MKACARCGLTLENNAEYCTRCGSTKFNMVAGQRPAGQRANTARPINTNEQQNIGNQAARQQTVRQQGARPAMNNRSNPNMTQQIPNNNINRAVNQSQNNQPKVVKPGMQNTNIPSYEYEQYNNINTEQSLTENAQEITVKDWLITLLFLLIPIYKYIYIITGMKNPKYSKDKQNFLKAFGLYYLITFGVSFLLSLIIIVITKL